MSFKSIRNYVSVIALGVDEFAAVFYDGISNFISFNNADSAYGFSVYSNSDHFGVHPACTAEYAQEINVVELFAFRALAVFAEKRKFFGFGAEVMEEFGDIEADNVNEARLLRQFADRQ